MNVLGSAIARYLSKLDGLYSVELPEGLMPEIVALVATANTVTENRAILIADERQLDGVATTTWRDAIGWRTTESRVFAWKRGNREPDTSFRSVVRPFISSRFPGAGGGECSLELLVRMTIAELWESRSRPAAGASFDSFSETALWVAGVLRNIFEGAGSTPSMHWSDRFLEHWAGILDALDSGLTTFAAPPDPRHAWEIVRVAGLPLPSQLSAGNPFVAAPKLLDQKDWPALASLWTDVVKSFIQPEGSMAVLLAALDHEVVGATHITPWRNLPWEIAQTMPASTPAPVIGKAIFTSPGSPTLLDASYPPFPIAPVPSWWGVSTEALENAIRRLREATPLRMDDTCMGVLRLDPANASLYVLNSRAGTLAAAPTARKWRARVHVGDIRLRFKEQWQILHVTTLEPLDAVDGDAWINPDLVEVVVNGAKVESQTSMHGPGEQLLVTIGLSVEYSAKETRGAAINGHWNPNRFLRVKLSVRRFVGQWDAGRTVEAEVDIVVPSPFQPTVIVLDAGKLSGAAPDVQDSYEASNSAAVFWKPDSTPTIMLKEEGRYDLRVYDGSISPSGQQFQPLSQPEVGGRSFDAAVSALFPPLNQQLDNGVLVTSGNGGGQRDLAVFAVRDRSRNLSSGLLSAVRGLPAGRKQPSGDSRRSILGLYQERIVQALCGVAETIPNSLYQYVIPSSEDPVIWPDHPGQPSPLFLFDPPSGSIPGIGAGPTSELARLPEWASFMQAEKAVSRALGFVPGSEDAWLSGIDFSQISAPTVHEYVDAHRRLVAAAKRLPQPADAFWAAYPFSVMVVEGRQGAQYAELLAVLLSPLHPVRLAWTYGVTRIAKHSNADPSLLQLVEGWNIPLTGITLNPAGQKRQMVAVPTDPGNERDFLCWSALAVLSDSGLSDLPVFSCGQPLPWGGRTGINARVVERAIKDYLLVHPHINSLQVDVRSVSPAPRSQEIDEALLNLVAAEGLSEVELLGGGTRVWDSEDRHGIVPTRERMFKLRGNKEQTRPFEWRRYAANTPPSEADVALIENANVHLAVVPSEAKGVLGLISLRRFAPSTLTNLQLDQSFTPESDEDILGLASLLLEIELSDPTQGAALRANPQIHALGIGRGARWEVLGAFNLDPALLSALVESATRGPDRRLLWEWRPSWMPAEKKASDLARRPYYVIARIPSSLRQALRSRQGLSSENVSDLLRVLGLRGIGLAALNAEAGTQESAAAGFFYAMQLFLPQGSPNSPSRQAQRRAVRGVIPVDPIVSILQGMVGRQLERRADLLAVSIECSESGVVKLCFVPVEVKHHGLPSQPEPIPSPTDRELSRARKQLAQTSDLIKEIAAALAVDATPAAVAGLYLKRLSLATLVDLAMSFTPHQPVATFRSAVLGGILSGQLSVGVGGTILLWFAPGSAQLGGGPCVIDRYGTTIEAGTRIRELFIDPSTVPGLWWSRTTLGANDTRVRAQVNDVIESSFLSCESAGVGASAIKEALRSLVNISESVVEEVPAVSHGEPLQPAQPAPAQHVAVRSADSPGPGRVTEHSIPVPTQEAQQRSQAPVPEAEAPLVGPIAVEPRVIVGWQSLSSRWTIVGKVAGTEDRVALDLDHPKTVGIFGYMGSGKSYLLGNLIESAVQPLQGINALPVPLSVVVFNYRRNASDRFELAPLAQPNENPVEIERLYREYGAVPSGTRNLHVLCLPGELRPERQREYATLPATELFFDPRTLGVEDWELLMGEPGSEAVFARTIRNTLVDMRSAGDITFENLQRQVLSRLTGQSRTAARLRFDFVRRYLSTDRGADFGSLLQSGRVLIVDLRQPLFNKDDALRFFLVCANQISKVQGRFNKMLVFDEAHEYMSDAFGDRMEARIRLMRHEGTSYVFATQDAASIPMGISRFLTTRFVFDLGTSENVQDLVQAAPEFRGYSLVGVQPGSCFLQANTSTNGIFARPREIRVRPRVSHHGGGTQIFSQQPATP